MNFEEMISIFILVFQFVDIKETAIGKLLDNYNHSSPCILGRG